MQGPKIPASRCRPQVSTEEPLAVAEETLPAVVYWLHGKLGKVEAIDLDEYDVPVAYVVAECQKAKNTTVWKKVEAWLHTRL